VTTTTWNPRWVNYCKAHGVTPEQAAEEDENRMGPGMSHSCAFLLWNQARIREFCKERGADHTPGWLDFETQSCFIQAHQEEYDAWLTEWVKKNGVS
jgi:hypothetical protein